MFAHIKALVAGINDHCIVHQVVRLQIIKYSSNLFINAVDDTHIVANIALVLPLKEGITSQMLSQHCLVARIIYRFPFLSLFWRHARKLMPEAVAIAFVRITHTWFYLCNLQVVTHFHVLFNTHLLFMGSTTSGGIVIVEGLGQGELDVFIEVEHVKWRHPVAMGCLVVDEECKRLLFVTLLEKLYCVIGNEVSSITFLYNVLSFCLFRTESWVVIVTLPWKDLIGIETFRLAKHVPFTYHTCLIACLLQVFANEWSILVNRAIQRPLATLMTIHSRH